MTDRREYHRNRRAQARAEGRCTRCNEPAPDGRSTCLDCQETTNAHRAEWRKRRKAA